MELKDFKKLEGGKLRATFSLYFPKMGVTIRDFKLLDGKTGPWILPPSREYKDKDGHTKYFYYFVVDDPRKEAFQKAVLHLVANQPADNIQTEASIFE